MKTTIMFINDVYEDWILGKIKFPKCIFYFYIFEDEAVLSIERNNICVTELCQIFSKLRDKVNTRSEQEFFVYGVMQKLKKLDSPQSNQI